MNRKRNVKTAMLLMLRKVGWLCKKPQPTSKVIRVSRSIQPDGTTTYYNKRPTSIPENPNSFKSELHVWNEIHKNTNKVNNK